MASKLNADFANVSCMLLKYLKNPNLETKYYIPVHAYPCIKRVINITSYSDSTTKFLTMCILATI